MKRIIPCVAVLAAVACDSGTSVQDPGPGAGGKADDAASTAPFTYPVPESPLRSATIEGSSFAASDGEALEYVFAPRHVISVPSDASVVEVGVEAIGTGLLERDGEKVHFVLSRRSGDEGAWKAIEIAGQQRFSSLRFDARSAEVRWETEVPEASGTERFELDEGVQLSVQAIAAVAADEPDDEHLVAYRLSAHCDEQACAAQPEALLPDRIDFTSSTLYPKSGVYDEQGQALYVTSLMDGGIVEVSTRGGAAKESIVFEGREGFSTVGVDLHEPTGTLWVCGVDNRDPAFPGEMWVFDVDDLSEPVETYPLSEAIESGNCNEVVAVDDRVAYTGDRQRAAVYRIDRTPDNGEPSVTVVADDPLLDQDVLHTGFGVGSNGIQVTPDGSRIVVAHYLPQSLVTFPVDDPSDIVEIDLDDAGPTLFSSKNGIGGPAGMIWADGALLAVFPEDIMRITPRDPDWNSVWVQKASTDFGPTEGEWLTGPILVGGALYVTNGETGKFLRLEPDDDPNADFFAQKIDWSLFDR